MSLGGGIIPGFLQEDVPELDHPREKHLLGGFDSLVTALL